MNVPLLFPAAFSVGYGTRAVARTGTRQLICPAPPHCSITLLCGANGSGKTTLMRTLAGSLPLLAGDAILGSVPLRDLRRRGRVSYLPEVLDFCPEMEGNELLRLLTPASPKDISEALGELGVDAGVSFKRLSKGNRQKLRFLAGLLNVPRSDLVLMDEPFSGLDIDARETAMAMLQTRFSPESGKRLLIALHTERIPEGWCDSSLGLTHGRIVSGPAFESVYEARAYFAPGVVSDCPGIAVPLLT